MHQLCRKMKSEWLKIANERFALRRMMWLNDVKVSKGGALSTLHLHRLQTLIRSAALGYLIIRHAYALMLASLPFDQIKSTFLQQPIKTFGPSNLLLPHRIPNIRFSCANVPFIFRFICKSLCLLTTRSPSDPWPENTTLSYLFVSRAPTRPRMCSSRDGRLRKTFASIARKICTRSESFNGTSIAVYFGSMWLENVCVCVCVCQLLAFLMHTYTSIELRLHLHLLSVVVCVRMSGNLIFLNFPSVIEFGTFHFRRRNLCLRLHIRVFETIFGRSRTETSSPGHKYFDSCRQTPTHTRTRTRTPAQAHVYGASDGIVRQKNKRKIRKKLFRILSHMFTIACAINGWRQLSVHAFDTPRIRRSVLEYSWNGLSQRHVTLMFNFISSGRRIMRSKITAN